MLQVFKLLLFVLVLFFALLSCYGSSITRLERHMERGEEFLKSLKPDRAIVEFKNVIKIEPEHAEGHYKLGMAYLEKGGRFNLQSAFSEFMNAVELKPDIVEAQLKLAQMFFLSRQFSKAESSLKSVFAEQPDNYQAVILQANLLAEKNDVDRGILLLKNLPDSVSDLYETNMAIARLYLLKEDFSQAEKAYRAALTSDSEAITPRLRLADLYTLKNNREKARTELRLAIEKRPADTEVLFALASLHTAKAPEKTEKIYRKLLSDNPQHPKAYSLLAKFYRALGRDSEAVLALKRGVVKSNHNSDLKCQLAEMLFELGQKADAKKYIESILRKNPDDHRGLYLRAKISFAEKRFKQTISDLKISLKEAPDFSPSHYLLGMAFEAVGNIGKAIEEFKLAPEIYEATTALAKLYLKSGEFNLALAEAEKILSRRPADHTANLIAGKALFSMQNYPEAIIRLSHAVNMAPDEPGGYVDRGMVYAAQRRDDLALEDFEKALRLNPDLFPPLEMIVSYHLSKGAPALAIERARHQLKKVKNRAKVYYLLGRIYKSSGNLGPAREAFGKAIGLRKDLFGAVIELGKIFAHTGEFKKAEAAFQNVIAAKPGLSSSYILLARIYEQQNKIEPAIETYKKVLELEPRMVTAANSLAWLYAEHDGDLEVAQTLAETAVKYSHRDPNVLDTLGWIYFKKNAILKSIQLLTEAIDLSPGDPTITYHLGMAYYKKGEFKKADDFLTRSLSINQNHVDSITAKRVVAGIREQKVRQKDIL